MKLKQPLPIGRSYDQILNHYLVEKSIAEKLKSSDRETRSKTFQTMYDELFEKVPDHPRLTQRESDIETEVASRAKMRLISRVINEQTRLVEFAPGDCRFAFKVAPNVSEVIGIDICDQRSPNADTPANFKLIIYDGYNLPDIEENSIDVVFSYQLIEHLHPADTRLHFELVSRILKNGGKYVLQTPHALSGPYDVSKFFCDAPEGFHLKEWQYSEIVSVLNKSGFRKVITRWETLGIDLRLPENYFVFIEKVFGKLPKSRIRKISKRLIPMVYLEAIK